MCVFPRATAGDLRTFTDVEGRSIVAEIVQATDTTVRVRREDDRLFDIALEKLSAADRAYIAGWRVEQALAFRGLSVGAHRVRLDSERVQTRSSTRKTEEWCYRITVRNESSIDLQPLTVDYRLFYIDDSAKAERDELPLSRRAGRLTVPRLAAGDTTELQTAAVTLQAVRLKPGRHDRRNSKQKVEDALAGIWVRVQHEGKLLHEFASPTTLLKSEAW